MAAIAPPARRRQPFRLAGWAWSQAYRRLLAQGVPCGCDALQNATPASPDETAEESAQATHAQRIWRCPGAGYSPADAAAELDENAQATIEDIERLTHATGLRTCPNAYLRLPWVVAIERLHRHREKHMLSMVRQRLANVEVEAFAVIDDALAEREAYEIKTRLASLPAPVVP